MKIKQVADLAAMCLATQPMPQTARALQALIDAGGDSVLGQVLRRPDMIQSGTLYSFYSAYGRDPANYLKELEKYLTKF